MRALVGLCLLMASGTVAAGPRPATVAYAAIAADVLSTRYAINAGAVEQNPLYGPDPSDGQLLAGALLRAGIVYALDHYGEDTALRIVSSLYLGVAMNNVAEARGMDRRGPIVIGVALPWAIK